MLELVHKVGGEAQRRSLHLEHQLTDSEASLSPHLPRGRRQRKDLEQKGRGAVNWTGLVFTISTSAFRQKIHINEMMFLADLTLPHTHLTVHCPAASI